MHVGAVFSTVLFLISLLRLHSITCLCRVNSSNITLRDDQLEPVLNVLKVSHMILTELHDHYWITCSLLSHMILVI